MLQRNLVFKIIIAVYIGLAIFRLTDPTLKLFKVQSSPHPVIASAPSDIKIPKINLDLAVSPSVVQGNNWELFDDRVAWLSTSALPLAGNTILYAHDIVGLFGNLYKLSVGDEIDIYNGNWISYKVTELRSVEPTDVSAILTDKQSLSLRDKNRLTLYTCEGSFDQKRLVVYAESK